MPISRSIVVILGLVVQPDEEGHKFGHDDQGGGNDQDCSHVSTGFLVVGGAYGMGLAGWMMICGLGSG